MISIILFLVSALQYNQNPVHLDSQGQAYVFLQDAKYDLILYAPNSFPGGQKNECLGTPTGKAEWAVENVYGPLYTPKDGRVSARMKSGFLKQNGQPAAGYLLCSYKAGTKIPMATLSEPLRLK